jgi:rhamnosyltransferase
VAPEPRNTFAAVVTFNPDAGLAQRVAALLPQVARVLLIDNGSVSPAREQLQALAQTSPRIELHELGDNLGIAAALNRAAQLAADAQANWLLCMDQDSDPAADLIAQLGQVHRTLPASAPVGILAANPRLASGKTGYRVNPGQSHVPLKVAITSGSLLSLDAWRQVGPFREDFFIDEVDHEYCLRLRKRGWRIVGSVTPLLNHRLGSAASHDRPPAVTISHHAPLRRYYMTRNVLLLSREYLWHEPAWVLTRLAQVMLYNLLAVTVERDRWAKLGAVARGLCDGCRGRAGKREN